jgi:hypothetical protein
MKNKRKYRYLDKRDKIEYGDQFTSRANARGKGYISAPCGCVIIGSYPTDINNRVFRFRRPYKKNN